MRRNCSVCLELKEKDEFSASSWKNQEFVCLDCGELFKAERGKRQGPRRRGDNLKVRKERKCLKCDRLFTTASNNRICNYCHSLVSHDDVDYDTYQVHI